MPHEMPALSDTSAEAEEVQMELLRRMTVRERSALMCSLNRTALFLARRAIARANPGASEQELGLIFIETHYGPELACEVRQYLKNRSDEPAGNSE